MVGMKNSGVIRVFAELIKLNGKPSENEKLPLVDCVFSLGGDKRERVVH